MTASPDIRGAGRLPPTAVYDVHGVGVEVVAAEPAVSAAIEHRLRGFRGPPPPGPALRLEFAGADGVGPPPGPGRPVYDTPHGTLHYHPAADALYGELDGVRLHCAAGAGVARFGSAAYDGPALYLATHPLATVSLMELLERRGRHSLHAGCLADDGRGVLLAGPTGAGKSTLALALLRAGLGFLSDDVVWLTTLADGTVEVLGFADTLGVTEGTAARFAELRAAPPANGFPKRLVRVEEAFGVTPVARCVPCALLFPEIVRDRPSALHPLDASEALLRLVPDVLLTQPAGTQAHLAAIAALLAQVRCYRLESGTDLGRAAGLVVDLLSRTAA